MYLGQYWEGLRLSQSITEGPRFNPGCSSLDQALGDGKHLWRVIDLEEQESPSQSTLIFQLAAEDAALYL